MIMTLNERIAQLFEDRRTKYPAEQLSSMWNQWVAGCETGYNWEYDEYEYELGLRDDIQAVLEDSLCQNLDGFEAFRQQTCQIDERFKTLINLGPKVSHWSDKWWRRSLPPLGRERFADSVESSFGITLQKVGTP